MEPVCPSVGSDSEDEVTLRRDVDLLPACLQYCCLPLTRVQTPLGSRSGYRCDDAGCSFSFVLPASGTCACPASRPPTVLEVPIRSPLKPVSVHECSRRLTDNALGNNVLAGAVVGLSKCDTTRLQTKGLQCMHVHDTSTCPHANKWTRVCARTRRGHMSTQAGLIWKISDSCLQRKPDPRRQQKKRISVSSTAAQGTIYIASQSLKR